MKISINNKGSARTVARRFGRANIFELELNLKVEVS